MNKYIWLFGGFSGVLASVSEYLIFSGNLAYDGFRGVWLFKLLILVFSIVFAVMAIKKVNRGISLGRTMFVSVLISLVRSAFLIGGFLMMYYPNGEFYKPVKEYSYKVSIKEHQKDKNFNFEKTRAEIDEQFSLEGYPKYAILGSLITSVVVGVFLGLIVASKPMINQ
jgi:apolipoprotein N-acyltransferase